MKAIGKHPDFSEAKSHVVCLNVSCHAMLLVLLQSLDCMQGVQVLQVSHPHAFGLGQILPIFPTTFSSVFICLHKIKCSATAGHYVQQSPSKNGIVKS